MAKTAFQSFFIETTSQPDPRCRVERLIEFAHAAVAIVGVFPFGVVMVKKQPQPRSWRCPWWSHSSIWKVSVGSCQGEDWTTADVLVNAHRLSGLVIMWSIWAGAIA